MEKKDYKDLSNADIRLSMETLKNEYEAKKAKVVALCEEMESLEAEYKKAEQELKIRKNIII